MWQRRKSKHDKSLCEKVFAFFYNIDGDSDEGPGPLTLVPLPIPVDCTEGVEGIEVLVLVDVNLVKVQGLALQLVGHQHVVDDIVLGEEGVLGVCGHHRVVGHVVHLSVDVLLLVPGPAAHRQVLKNQ